MIGLTHFCCKKQLDYTKHTRPFPHMQKGGYARLPLSHVVARSTILHIDTAV